MSKEGKDTTFKPIKKSEMTDQASTRQSGCRITRRVDYREVELLSLGGELERKLLCRVSLVSVGA